jgi:hypothetical protein
MNWSSGDRPLKWKHQQSQTDFALNFLRARDTGFPKGAILALSADQPEKYFQMFSEVASSFHFAELNPQTYLRLTGKIMHRYGKDVWAYPTDFFHMVDVIGARRKIKVIDFDTCKCYSDNYAWQFRRLFRSGRMCNMSVLRWTFCPRVGLEFTMAGVEDIARHARAAGYKVEQLPTFSYVEMLEGDRIGTAMVTGQMHLDKRP